eukprot:SAG11_NODE_1417_length_4966_cov_4.590592_3_plen_98_part_00
MTDGDRDGIACDKLGVQELALERRDILVSLAASEMLPHGFAVNPMRSGKQPITCKTTGDGHLRACVRVAFWRRTEARDRIPDVTVVLVQVRGGPVPG